MRKPGSTETDVLNLHSKVQASLAHGFCLLVQLLVDKNSSVCARAKYLIASINEPSLDVGVLELELSFNQLFIITEFYNHFFHVQAMKFYLKNFFYEYPFYREEVLSTLSLLDSALPALNFLSVDILTNLLRIATSHRDSSAKASETDPTLQLGIKKKVRKFDHCMHIIIIFSPFLCTLSPPVSPTLSNSTINSVLRRH